MRKTSAEKGRTGNFAHQQRRRRRETQRRRELRAARISTRPWRRSKSNPNCGDVVALPLRNATELRRRRGGCRVAIAGMRATVRWAMASAGNRYLCASALQSGKRRSWRFILPTENRTMRMNLAFPDGNHRFQGLMSSLSGWIAPAFICALRCVSRVARALGELDLQVLQDIPKQGRRSTGSKLRTEGSEQVQRGLALFL